MRLLFALDAKDYDINSKAIIRPSVRGIIIRGDRVGMVHSLGYDYYKFPGGGIEKDESQIDTLMREVAEETGLSVMPGTVREYGYVHRAQKSGETAVFIQDNYYYLCETEAGIAPQHLDEYEADERFTLEFVDPAQAVIANRENDHGNIDPFMLSMLERDARVLEMLIEEGYFAEK